MKVMSNKLDKQYTDLLQDILDNGVNKQTRNGEVLSVFGRQIRHDMKTGFPLLTTKKMAWKSIVTELLWFLRGDTNIKFLVDNGCHIWDGDAYKNYDNIQSTHHAINEARNMVNMMDSKPLESTKPLTQEEFINKIKTDDEFANKWGSLGKIYGYQWRNWGGWTDTKQTGFLHKTDNGWTVKWSDLHSFAHGTEWLTTPIQNSDQSLYSDEDEGKKVYYKNITLSYDEKSFFPIQVAKVIDNKFDKYVGGTDQIQNLINDLKTNPDSRRLMVNAWNVGKLDQMVLPPCHYGFQVYTRELSEEERWRIRFDYYPKDKQFPWDRMALPSHRFLDDFNIPRRAISLMYNQRSVDTFLGLPFNIASYGLLLEIIAKTVNMVPDELIGNLGDVHLYNNHIEQAKEQIGREMSFIERTNYGINILGYDGLLDFGHTQNDDDKILYCLNTWGVPIRTREPYPLPTLKHLKTDEFYKSLGEDLSLLTHLDNTDFVIDNYQSHPTIKAPLSN